MSIVFPTLATLIIIFWSVSSARTIRVPQDATTIQAGLDSLENRDTVFISFGTYTELLTAPQLSFTMLGELRADSGQTALPTIDGTILGGHDSTSVLTVPNQSHPTIKNIRFRNIGRDGIRCWADSLTLDMCVFDSTDHGVYEREFDQGAFVRVTDCIFNDNDHSCLRILSGNTLKAKRCLFSGSDASNRALVGGGFVILDSCTFTSIGQRMLLHSVNTAQVTNCTFEPVHTDVYGVAVLLTDSSVHFANNFITGCTYGYHAVRVYTNYPDLITIENNAFENCSGITGSHMASGAFGMLFGVTPSSLGALVQGNTFTNCSGSVVSDDIWPSVLHVSLISSNHFVNDNHNGLPSIGGSGSPWQSTPVTLRNNYFLNCGYALDGSPHTDAILNWWGDPSGPYHELDNPLGQGDTITGPVQFIPWLEDTTTAIGDSRRELPSELSLKAYPNPFNATTRIEFSIERTGQVELLLFDVLGRNVVPLLRGSLRAGQHEVSVDLGSLASGVYFARLEAGDQSLVTKLVLMK